MAHKIDSSTAVTAMPTPGTAGTAGWFTDGNPGLGVPGTVVTADWLNAQQAEILNVLAAAGITPDKTKQDQLITALRKIGRTKLTAATTLNVATTGNDNTGDGSAGAPFATVQGAWNYLIQNIDVNNQSVAIQVANGTYTLPAYLAYAPIGTSAPITIQGNTASPSSVLLNVTNANCFSFANSGQVVLRGFKVQATGTQATFVSGGRGLLAALNSQVYFSNMDFGACGYAHIYSASGAYIGANSNAANSVPYTISGGAPIHMAATDFSIATNVGCMVTITGTPNFSMSFVYSALADLQSYFTTYTGSATGQRYTASNNGLILVNGNGATYLPGSVAGTTSLGGIYV